jgi:cell division transport system permease protein
MIRRLWLLLTLAALTALLGGVMVFSEMMSKTVRSWERIVEVDVFLRGDITAEQTAALKSRIDAIPQVASYKYLSKDEALQEFKDLNSESPALVENIEKDALPASYRIRLKNSGAAEDVSRQLSRQPGVEEINFGGDDVGKLLTVTTWVTRGVTAAIVAALLLVGFVVIRNIKTPTFV